MEKPLRYINHEINAIHKDFAKAEARFCLIYPDVYELGISHLGLKILYSIINSIQNAMADRAYAPWVDQGEKLFKTKSPLTAIESKTPLKNFDCLGFTLSSELIYTNVLYMLDLAQIPLCCDERDDTSPIIFAGGINAINPQPLVRFIDAFFIGEAEQGIIDIVNIFLSEKNRKQRLKKLSELPFMYVPMYSGDRIVVAQKYNNFPNSEQTHFPQLVPLLESTHNRYTAEVMRGCTRGCRFCQAGMFYRPVREKNPEIIIKQLIQDVRESGWDSAGLMSLSTTDYSCIKPLLEQLIVLLKDSGVSLSLPSLRIDSIDTSLIELMNHLKKSGITLAPEAGTQRLRNIINKNLTEEEILNAVKISQEADAKLIKLYFMIGLPFETDDDIKGIIDLIEKIIIITSRKMRINVSISPFVPKPFTPFQWVNMENEKDVLDKALRIKFAFSKYKFIKLNYHTIELAYLEAVLSRGGADVGLLLEKAYQKGAIFNGWHEFFDYSIWLKTAKEIGYDWYKTIMGYKLNEKLPWDNISIGIEKNFLIREYKKASEGIITNDCRNGNCNECGMSKAECRKTRFEWKIINEKNTQPIVDYGVKEKLQILNPVFRVYFSKMNDLKYISHLDFLRLIHRLLMMSKLPIAFSQGFNPHPKTSFCPPLSSGIEGENEFFDIQFTENITGSSIISGINKMKIKDLDFHKVESISKNSIPINEFIIENLYVEIPPQNMTQISDELSEFITKDHFYIIKERKGVAKNINLKENILVINLKDGILYIKKYIQGASIFDILENLFNINRERAEEMRIIRSELCIQKTN